MKFKQALNEMHGDSPYDNAELEDAMKTDNNKDVPMFDFDDQGKLASYADIKTMLGTIEKAYNDFQMGRSPEKCKRLKNVLYTFRAEYDDASLKSRGMSAKDIEKIGEIESDCENSQKNDDQTIGLGSQDTNYTE